MFFSLLFAFAISNASHASDSATCASVDMRSELPPVQNQGDSGWCYAFTTADMVSQKVGFAVSAADVATSYILADPRELQYSEHQSVRSYYQQNPGFGHHLFYDRTRELKPYFRKNFLSKDGIIDIGGDEAGAILLLNTQGLCAGALNKLNVVELHKNNLAPLQQLWQNYLLANPNPDFFNGYAGAISDPYVKTQAKLFRDYIDKSCSPRITNVPALIPRERRIAFSLNDSIKYINSKKTTWQKARRPLIAEINLQLNQHKVVAIGHSAYDLVYRAGEKDNGDHSSLIAARRLQGDKCLYFVRNAWGTSCDDYRDEFLSTCEPENGGTWVDESQLKTLYSVISVQ